MAWISVFTSKWLDKARNFLLGRNYLSAQEAMDIGDGKMQ
jgi:hypothetical protein